MSRTHSTQNLIQFTFYFLLSPKKMICAQYLFVKIKMSKCAKGMYGGEHITPKKDNQSKYTFSP